MKRCRMNKLFMMKFACLEDYFAEVNSFKPVTSRKFCNDTCTIRDKLIRDS